MSRSPNLNVVSRPPSTPFTPCPQLEVVLDNERVDSVGSSQKARKKAKAKAMEHFYKAYPILRRVDNEITLRVWRCERK